MTAVDKKKRNPRDKRAPEVVRKPAADAPAVAAGAGGRRTDRAHSDRPNDRDRDRDRDRERERAPARKGQRGKNGERALDERGGGDAEGPKFIGGPRNEHGTRVARRVTCSRCGTSDHVPYVPKDPTKALCRNCAAEVLKTFETGTKVRMPTRPAVCNLCGTPFQLPISAEDDGDPLCPNCLRGFTTWQGSVDVPFDERKQAVVEERLSGALVRKRKR